MVEQVRLVILHTVLSSTGRVMDSGHASPAGLISGLSAGRGAPGTTFRPNFTAMKDAGKGVTWQNMKAFVEVKFDRDNLTFNQKDARNLAGESKFIEINEEDCKCS